MSHRMLRRVLGRYAAAPAVATLLVVTGCTSGGTEQPTDAASQEPSAGAVDGEEQVEAAGDWLTRQLRQGLIRDQERDVVDFGQAIDIALAYVEVGERRQAVTVIAEAVSERRDDYLRSGTNDLPGPTAQTLLLLEQARIDVGDLPQVLETLASNDPAFPGRLRNSTLDDMGDVVGQAYGARALIDADSRAAGDVAAFLLQQQCDAGFFRAGFSALDSSVQDCDGMGQGRPDVVTTAQVLLLMAPITQQFRDGQESMRRAATWLADQQDADGRVAAGRGQDPDTVTTGLVARALHAWGDRDAAAAGAAAIAPLQLMRGNDAGAVARDAEEFDRIGGGSLGVPPPDSWRRATTQAVAALTYLD